MKQIFIHQQHSPRLVIFFAGWGMDETPFQSIETAGSDLLICYDYRTLDFDASLCTGYEEVTVVAWSMGVWVAMQTLHKEKLPIAQSIAINGTPYPIDDSRGIAQTVFEGTRQGLNEESLRKFQRRMCGSATACQEFLTIAPQRSAEELKEELSAIEQHYATLPPVAFHWNKAIVGTADRIFLAENQYRAWKERETEVETVEAAHYATTLFQSLGAPVTTNKTKPE